MNDRRRFLHVLGATTAAAALPACGGSDSTSGTTGAGGAGGSGAGGAGGAGGGTSSVTSSSTTSSVTTSATTSTGTGATCEETTEGIAVGVPADFAATGLHLLPGTKILIGRDAKGLYALTSVCTHEFCDMDGMKSGGGAAGTVTAKGITCNCHGSKFDNYGAVVMGPANKPLKAYAMSLCDGKIYVDITNVVSINERLDA